jgi:hypothetical protein
MLYAAQVSIISGKSVYALPVLFAAVLWKVSRKDEGDSSSTCASNK